MKKLLFFLTVSILAFTKSFAQESENLGDSEGFKNLLDSVVKIDMWEEKQSDGSSRIARGIGSGVILSEEGYVLTNAHVVNTYTIKIIVTLANLEKVKAELIGWDHWTDLAVIKIDMDDIKKRNLKFSHASLGDSDKLKPAQTVFAVGTPHGFVRTVTKGIISNATRFFEGTILDRGYETGTFNTWIQTDAAINPGNSGGPLVLSDGTVIGINTRGYLGANNLGFAVPSNTAKKVFHDLCAQKKVDRSYVGISIAPLQDMEQFFELDANKGMLIKNVDRGSSAALAGILPGDIVLKINDNVIDGRYPEQLPPIMNSIAILPIGSEVKFEVLRNGKTSEYTMKTETLESRVGKEFPFEKWGLGIREITKVYAREARIDTDSNLMVIDVRSGFPCDLGKVYTGDIIVSVNREKVNTIEQFKAVYEKLSKTSGKIMIEVSRDHSLSYCIIDQ